MNSPSDQAFIRAFAGTGKAMDTYIQALRNDAPVPQVSVYIDARHPMPQPGLWLRLKARWRQHRVDREWLRTK